MGRIHRGWCKYKKDTGDETYLSDDEWGVRLVKEILEMLTRKWNVRCNIMETEGKRREEERLRERCTETRKTITEYYLLCCDRWLLQERYVPCKSLRVGTINECYRTLELAIEAKEKLA